MPLSPLEKEPYTHSSLLVPTLAERDARSQAVELPEKSAEIQRAQRDVSPLTQDRVKPGLVLRPDLPTHCWYVRPTNLLRQRRHITTGAIGSLGEENTKRFLGLFSTTLTGHKQTEKDTTRVYQCTVICRLGSHRLGKEELEKYLMIITPLAFFDLPFLAARGRAVRLAK